MLSTTRVSTPWTSQHPIDVRDDGKQIPILLSLDIVDPVLKGKGFEADLSSKDARTQPQKAHTTLYCSLWSCSRDGNGTRASPHPIQLASPQAGSNQPVQIDHTPLQPAENETVTLALKAASAKTEVINKKVTQTDCRFLKPILLACLAVFLSGKTLAVPVQGMAWGVRLMQLAMGL